MADGTVKLTVLLVVTMIHIQPHLASSLSAGCLEGAWVDGSWRPSSCSLPSALVGSIQCLAHKNILFLGDSTTRMFFDRLVALLNLNPLHHPCNMQMGWGCFDCTRGCHSFEFHNQTGNAPDWVDKYANTPQNTLLSFSWKPQMFSVDDQRLLIRLAHRQQDIPVHAIVVNKGGCI